MSLSRLAALGVAGLLVGMPLRLSEPNPVPPINASMGVRADGPAVEVEGSGKTELGVKQTSPENQPSGPVLSDTRYADQCGAVFGDALLGSYPCAGPSTADYTALCPTSDPVPPLWQRTRPTDPGPWGEWTLLADAHCTARPTVTPELVLAEFRRLPLTPSPLTRQPDRAQVLLNVDTIAYTSPAPQTLHTTILGTGVTIHATPRTYTWDFGDHHPFTTSSPGHPYPDHDVAVAYAEPGDHTITLTTTWSATYTLAGDGAVHTVPGTATTTSTSTPFSAVEARNHLVRGTCALYPHDPGC